MSHIDPLLERNRHFATTSAREDLGVRPNNLVYVITCLDPRVDPSAFLELKLGDAMVIRNAGGRVPPDAVRDLAFICYMTETMGTDAGPLFEVAVIHHTQCGTGFLADEGVRRGFAERIGADEALLAAMAVTDPEATVRSDVELLRSSPLLSARISVSGHVYDVATGLVQTIIPASPMHTR